MKANFYIDGFNLYYRAVKGTPYKWLDLSKLCQRLTPTHSVNRIRYFTALVQPWPGNPDQLRRQLTYIRALQTIPTLSVHRGQFRTDRVTRPLAMPIPGMGNLVEVLDTKEKGSDVNLSTYLLVDGYDGDYEQAVVISNDSDLALPIRMVRDKLGLPVGVVNPDRKNQAHKELVDAATFVRGLWVSTLRASQFPQTVTDAQGTITKPATW